MILVKYTPGAFVGQLSGSMGSTTASHNKGGSYLRNRTIPVNPSTAAQTSVRSAFTSFAQDWRVIGDALRTGWTNLAILDPIIDTQGNPITLAGHTYYNRFNMRRRSVGLARLTVAPPIVELPPSISSAVLTIGSLGPVFDYTPTVVSGTATNFQQLMATDTRSAGVSFTGKGDYRLIGEIAGDEPAVPPEDLVATYEAVFGTSWRTRIGERIFLRATGVSDSGFVGDFTEFSSLIGA